MKFLDKINSASRKARESVADVCDDLKEFSGKTADEIGNAFAAAPEKITNFGNKFSESDFWKKISKVASKAGRSVMTMALTLYYGIESASMKDKILIAGALGYFILPADFIPDFIPVVGFSDDLAALTAIYNTVKESLTQNAAIQANAKLEEWFPAADQSALQD